MPEMDGIEVLSEMNRLHYTDDIPVIMISADNSDTNIRRAFDMGVTDYKPTV
ncbi:MAG: response regulator [Oscillospiraceae bacterium]